MKKYFFNYLAKLSPIVIFLNSSIFLNSYILKAENLFEVLEIDSTTKTEDDSSIIPTNPFEIVEMIRRYNSMNDATKPNDAIDDALDSFNNLEVNSEI